MATRKKESSYDLAPAAQRNLAALVAHDLVLGGGAPSREEEGIVQKTRADLLREQVILIKQLKGQQVLQAMAVATERNYAAFLEGDRALRSQVRHADDQADLEAFLDRIRKDHANDLVDLRILGANKVGEIIVSPVDLPQGREQEIIEEVPSVWKRVFGGHIVKRVK